MLTAATITDAQILDLREKLFAGPADARQLHGVVACWAALGRSHRQMEARAYCAEILDAMRKERDVSIRRPKTQTKTCTHCKRRRPRLKIEWHPGIEEWQCSDFTSCDEAIEHNSRRA
jgi:hypothetical protein